MKKSARIFKQLHDNKDDVIDQLLCSRNWMAHIDTVQALRGDLDLALYKLKYRKCRREFGEREDDIYIVTHPKSGTSWLQMILYQLTTDGSMNFGHIYEVSPWLSWCARTDTSPAQVPSPRILKTHDSYEEASTIRKGRFIYVVRDGMDVMFSLYHHSKDYYNPKVSFKEVFESRIKDWFSHVSSWLKNKSSLPVLYLRYEDMLRDLETEIDRIIPFCNLQPDQATIRRTLKRSRFTYMKRHQKKFGEPQGHSKVLDKFIRKGIAGDGRKSATEKQEWQYKKGLREHFAGIGIMDAYNE